MASCTLGSVDANAPACCSTAYSQRGVRYPAQCSGIVSYVSLGSSVGWLHCTCAMTTPSPEHWFAKYVVLLRVVGTAGIVVVG